MRERAEAERHEAEAKMHERGLADDKLVEDHERDRFAGVTGERHHRRRPRPRPRPTTRRRRDARATADDAPVEQQHADTAYEQGREDERVEEGRTPRT